MKLNLRIFLLAAIVAITTFTVLKFNTNHSKDRIKFIDGLPIKPSKEAYVNTTDLKYLDKIAKFETRRGGDLIDAEIAIVLLEELPENKNIQNYATDIFKAWDIGREHNGRGILYVLERKNGLLKIETSYELEGLFPDAFIASYQQTIKNYFEKDQLGDVISHLVMEMAQRAQEPDYKMSAYQSPQATGEYLSGGGGITGNGYLINRIETNLEATYKHKGELSKYQATKTPEMAVEKFLEMLENGIASPHVGLLTEGSRYMLIEYKRSANAQKNRYRSYEKSMPYKVVSQGNYAFARFDKIHCRPIHLRRDKEGLWYVDETKNWAYADGFHSKGGRYYIQAFLDRSPWSWAVNYPEAVILQGLDRGRPAPFPLDRSLKKHIEKLEANIKAHPDDAENYFKLAEILFFENYWIKDALSTIHKGLELDPYNERYLRMAIFFGSKMPDYRFYDDYLARLGKINPDDSVLEWFVKCYKKNGTSCSYY